MVSRIRHEGSADESVTTNTNNSSEWKAKSNMHSHCWLKCFNMRWQKLLYLNDITWHGDVRKMPRDITVWWHKEPMNRFFEPVHGNESDSFTSLMKWLQNKSCSLQFKYNFRLLSLLNCHLFKFKFLLHLLPADVDLMKLRPQLKLSTLMPVFNLICNNKL